MSFKGFPITLNLNDKHCLVIGGGSVAERKINTLLTAAPTITVISPDLTKGLRLLVQSEKIGYVERHYKPGDLNGYFLAVAATDDANANKAIFREAETNNILINVVDKPELCSFFMPAVVNRGDLQIAVSTNGKSPALAKRIRRRLEEEYGPEYAPWLNLVSEYRRKIMQKEPDKRKRKQAYDRLFNSNILEKVRKLSRNNPEMVNNKIDVDKLISRFSEQ